MDLHTLNPQFFQFLGRDKQLTLLKNAKRNY